MYTPEVDQIVPLGQPAGAAQTEAAVTPPLAVVAPSPAPPVFAVAPMYAPPPPQASPWATQPIGAPVQVPSPASNRHGWVVAAGIAAIGLIASGTLGYFLYTTTGQRDSARSQLKTTQATLADTNKKLATRTAIDTYVYVFVLHSGRVSTEYGNVIACDSYITCRSAVQDDMTELKAFQSARAGATVPAPLASADSQVGDALSAAIAADSELITGMDTNNTTMVKEGFSKLDAAMLSLGKAESALSAAIG